MTAATKGKRGALAELAGLEAAVREARAAEDAVRLERQGAERRVQGADVELSEYFADVAAGDRPASAKREAELRAQRDELRENADPAVWSGRVAGAGRIVAARETDVAAFIGERRDDLVAELMAHALAARDGLLAAAEALRAASGEWQTVRNRWGPLLERWGVEVSGFPGIRVGGRLGAGPGAGAVRARVPRDRGGSCPRRGPGAGESGGERVTASGVARSPGRPARV